MGIFMAPTQARSPDNEVLTYTVKYATIAAEVNNDLAQIGKAIRSQDCARANYLYGTVMQRWIIILHALGQNPTPTSLEKAESIANSQEIVDAALKTCAQK